MGDAVWTAAALESVRAERADLRRSHSARAAAPGDRTHRYRREKPPASCPSRSARQSRCSLGARSPASRTSAAEMDLAETAPRTNVAPRDEKRTTHPCRRVSLAGTGSTRKRGEKRGQKVTGETSWMNDGGGHRTRLARFRERRHVRQDGFFATIRGPISLDDATVLDQKPD